VRTLPRSRPGAGLPGAAPGAQPGARRRPLAALTATAGLLALAGCSGSASRGFLPDGVTSESPRVISLWNGAWIAALAVGVLVWGLTLWCVVRYRKRKNDHRLPDQLRYNLPLEILYTVVPLFMVAVLFYYTQRDESALLRVSSNPQNVVNVAGKRWAWDFNYITENAYETSTQVNITGQVADSKDLPELYLPVNETTRFYLTTRDVNHSFWVPAFLMKMDLIAGRVNSFQVTPTETGVFAGKCAELCGTYHAYMLFEVHVVPRAQYDQHIAQLKARGQTGRLGTDLNQDELIPEDQKKIPTTTGGQS
jgi:cytochrome c oxidase subunit II